MRRLTMKFMGNPPCEYAVAAGHAGPPEINARKTARPQWIRPRHGRSFAAVGPLVTGGLAEILQRGECLQQPDADAGDRTGQETDAGNHHQYAHGALDRVE